MAHLEHSPEPLRRFLRQTLEDAKSAVALYFRPLRSISWLLDLDDRRRLPNEWSGRDEFAKLVKDVVCYNQASIIEYSYLVAEKHKTMKTLFKSDSGEVSALQEAASDLMNYLNKHFFEATYRNFHFIHSHFEKRHHAIPRVCVKGNFSHHDADTIISIFRDRPVIYNSDTAIEENSGFANIKSTGRFFLENNIPEAVIERNYVNPRLDTARIRADWQRGKSISDINLDWPTYWRDWSPERRHSDAYYRSTLIVPITLWNNDLSPEFRRLVRVENIDRVIFGFLCLDHTNADFFEGTDVSFGYIIADLLCVYAFSRMVYTDSSQTFAEVRQFLDSHSASVDIEKLDLNALAHRGRNKKRKWHSASRGKSTNKNQLVNVDDVLLNSVRPDISD